MQNVLILDANQRSALAATRSLGNKGIPVIVADETRNTLSGSSKYCKNSFTYPSPYEYPDDFIETLRKESIERDIRVIFPMTEITTRLMLKYQKEFKNITIPFGPLDAFDRLSDKWRLIELATQRDVPVPMTYFIKSHKDLSTIYPKLNFPVVLKPTRSGMFSNGKWEGAFVKYARSIAELEEIVASTPYFNHHPFLIQEYIAGEGRGIFAFYNQGEPVAFFAHRRLREKPPSGGVSVLSESVEIDPSMYRISRKILECVKWHGVAMVEFRVTAEGAPYLLEVNARFWGSLQLAVDAGVDFPWLVYQSATGKDMDRVDKYQIGVKNRWLLGDVDYLYMKLFKEKRNLPFFEKWKTILNFSKFFEKNMRYEVNRWNDMRPFFFELKRYIQGLKG